MGVWWEPGGELFLLVFSCWNGGPSSISSSFTTWKEMKWLEPSEPQPLPPSNIWHKSQFLNIKRRGKDLFWEFCRNVAGSNKYLKKFPSGSRAIQCVISPSFWLSEPDFGEYFRGNFKSLSDMRYPILHQHLTGGDDEAGSGLETEDWLLTILRESQWGLTRRACY